MDPQIRFTEKSVIIHRDENGFGLRVGGQNPVIVDCVHDNGAAWKAGVRKDDRIIKVNGTLVRSYDHHRVVQMIQNCTPFVNLTLHSPEAILTPDGVHQYTLGVDQNNGSVIAISSGINSQSSQTNNLQLHSQSHLEHRASSSSHLNQQRCHPATTHSPQGNLNWLLEIGDDLFQDSQQKQPSHSQQQDQLNPTNQQSSGGVNRLTVSGPTLLNHSNSTPSLLSTSSRITRSESSANTRDNPYYYYKTAHADESSLNDANTSANCNTNSSLLDNCELNTTKASSSNKSKYAKAKNLRSRLVEAITNRQTTPSSLSTSPSSSELSDEGNFDISNNDNKSVRLKVIKELVETEKTHTEKLKQLNDLLYKPIKAENLIPPDQLKMVFSCHRTLFKIHRQIYKKLVTAQPSVGKALIEIFQGELGRKLEKAASTFCACQSTNSDLLNKITRKETKSGEFLAQVANQQMLGRLGIKDLLASCFQRLTKYPLLLENLLKATPNTATDMVPPSSDIMDEFAYERSCIERALQCSRQILTHVNEAVNRAIAQNKLKEIWKKTDKHPSLPVINIDDEQLLHEGSLTLRLNRRQFEVYVLLLTHYLVILTRDNQDKYKLKYFINEGKSLPNNQISPIFNIDEHLVTRDSATDENGFYLLCKRKDESRICEFASQSPLERARWKEKIHMAQMFTIAVVPEDDNTLTRYTELISLTNSVDTPNNIAHSPSDIA